VAVKITYNHEKYIAEAIESVVSQLVDFKFELIIAEDCSSDNTRRISIEYAVKYKKMIRVLYSDRNVGVAKNYIRAFQSCRGEYIALCEGDDYWRDPLKLKKQVEFLRGNYGYVAAYHDSIVVAHDNVKVADSLLGSACGDYSPEQLIMIRTLPTQTIMFRKVFDEFPTEILKVGNVDSFQISLLGNYGGGKFLPDIVPSAYRLHPGGVWSGIKPIDANIMSVTTYYWLSAYYKRIERFDIAEKFAFLAMRVIYNQTGMSKLEFWKWTIATLYPNFYSLYKGFKSKLMVIFKY
jgi:glycosyltransferase involved in cell wall biosynthesis